MDEVVEHQDFCAIGFSGECTCRSLPERLTMYADKMQALHEAGQKADPKYRGIEIQAKIALVREAAVELSLLRSREGEAVAWRRRVRGGNGNWMISALKPQFSKPELWEVEPLYLARPSPPPGWKLVPESADSAMMNAGVAAANAEKPDVEGNVGHVQIRAAFNAMLSSAPEAKL